MTTFSDDTELYPLSAFLYDRDTQKLEDWQNKGVEFVELPEHTVTYPEQKTFDALTEPELHVSDTGTSVCFDNKSDAWFMSVLIYDVNGDERSEQLQILPAGAVTEKVYPKEKVLFIYTTLETAEETRRESVTVSPLTVGVPVCPLLTAMWERISLRVNEAYYDRFLAAETIEQWQRRLQVLTDRIALRYERAFRMYAGSDLEGDVSAKTVTTYDVTNGQSSKSRSIDTPDTSINDSSAYAGSTTENTGENTQKGTVSVATEGNGGILSQVNDNVSEWRDLETELVNEYAKCFLSTVWY